MRRHLKNAGWSIAESLGLPLLLLAATPIFLKHLGANGFGLWTLMVTIVSLGMIVNAGSTPAVIKLVAEASDRGPVALSQALSGALAVAVSAGGVASLLIFAFVVLFSSTLLSRMGDGSVVMIVGAAGAASLWIEQIDFTLSAALKGLERFGLAARIELLLKSGQILCCVGVVLIGGGLYGLVLSYTLTAAGRLAAKIWLLRGEWRGLLEWPSFRHAGPVVGLSKWGWAQGLAAVLFGVIDRFIVGGVLGAEELGYFAIALQLAAQLHTLVSSGFAVVTPTVSRKVAAEGMSAALRSAIWKLCASNVAIAGAGSICLLFVAHRILDIWVGQEATARIMEFFPGLVGAYGMLACNIVPYYILIALGEMRLIAVISLGAGATAIAMAVLLVPQYGLNGAGLSRCCYSLMALGLYIPLGRRLLAGSRHDPA